MVPVFPARKKYHNEPPVRPHEQGGIFHFRLFAAEHNRTVAAKSGSPACPFESVRVNPWNSFLGFNG
jgi:hypothetical protein